MNPGLCKLRLGGGGGGGGEDAVLFPHNQGPIVYHSGSNSINGSILIPIIQSSMLALTSFLLLAV